MAITPIKAGTGDVYFALTLLSKYNSPDRQGYYGLFQCICGRKKELSIASVSGSCPKNKSCGCLNGKWSTQDKTTHGQGAKAVRTREYNVWANMQQRCKNKNVPHFKNYGGRGITVCERWNSFENFYADMGKCNGLTIDRINNDGNYEPGNCRWIAAELQSKNRRNVGRAHCINGHAYSEENSGISWRGQRLCKACSRASWLRWNTKRKLLKQHEKQL